MATVSVRYIVHDVDAAIGFYCRNLGFTEVMHPAPTFAMLRGATCGWSSSAAGGGPGGGQAMPDGRVPEPGGWNRFSIEVPDLAAKVGELRDRWRSLPQRDRHRRGRQADPAGGPVRQPGRALRADRARGQAVAVLLSRITPPGVQKAACGRHTRSCVRLRRAGDRLRARRPEGRHRRGEARAAGGDHRAQGHDRRRVPEHRNDPVQDPARGDSLPDRPRPAGDVRAELPGQGRHHHRRPGRPDQPCGRPRDGRGAQPAFP